MSSGPQETIELRLPSQLRFLSAVDAVVQAFVAEFALDPDEVNNVSTAVIEAASNAMEHANQFSPTKHVTVRLRAKDNVVEADIEDEGTGFDHQPFERELGHEDLLKVRGRGIFIMRSFMDEVRFKKLQNGGTCVSLRITGKPTLSQSDAQDSAREN